jgi:hypothetical protein
MLNLSPSGHGPNRKFNASSRRVVGAKREPLRTFLFNFDDATAVCSTIKQPSRWQVREQRHQMTCSLQFRAVRHEIAR